ncbi:GTP cyclohydrolase IIa [Acidianus sulfidivorans JP7]|uniref:GTP cyclohydrolase III n=1 Tax=Acidianus sulfidivorans JP7 TaxID=619593 RepID=A0A2U9IMD9_9CREN|nr:GTP cyclohydrolase IIa [Acidianus sulfidivorans]AWR97182.1 GTP cyclohydrolase IIa [Acidianus sulfidivorans JP7]
MKIFLIELRNYREWTESLGYDREWKIQETQHELSKYINKIVAKYNGFLLPLRYDFFLIIADGISNQNLLDIYNKISTISPTKAIACLGYGKTPLEAEQNAFQCIHKNSQVLEDFPDELVTACHFDIDSFTELTIRTSAYTALMNFNNIYNKISNEIYKLGGITQYLGGDNFIAFIDYSKISDIIKITDETDKIKVGIGVGPNARIAMENATKALEEIRKTRDKKWMKLQSTLELHY